MNRLDLIRQLPEASAGLEIGVKEGNWSAEILSTPVRHLTLLDCWEFQPTGYEDVANQSQEIQNSLYEQVCERFKNEPRVTIWRTFSRKMMVNGVLRPMQIHFDFDWIYIDSNHSYSEVFADLEFYSQYAPILFLHDYIDNGLGFGVKAAVDDWLLLNGEKWRVDAITDEDTWETIKLVKV